MTTRSWTAIPLTPLRHLDLDRGAVARLRSALRLDHLVGDHVWDGVATADLPADPAARVASLSPLLGREGVLTLHAAAWVHLGGAPPDQIDLALERPVRTRPGPVRLRCVRYLPGETTLVAGRAVTTRLVTAADLARTCAPEGEDDDADSPGGTRLLARAGVVDALVALLEAGVDAAEVREHLVQRAGRTHPRTASEVLALAAARAGRPRSDRAPEPERRPGAPR